MYFMVRYILPNTHLERIRETIRAVTAERNLSGLGGSRLRGEGAIHLEGSKPIGLGKFWKLELWKWDILGFSHQILVAVLTSNFTGFGNPMVQQRRKKLHLQLHRGSLMCCTMKYIPVFVLDFWVLCFLAYWPSSPACLVPYLVAATDLKNNGVPGYNPKLK